MSDCIFCRIVDGHLPSYKVYEDEKTYAFFDINPAADYHTLVIPKNHYENIFDTPEDEVMAVSATVRKISRMYKEKLGINNIQIICSSGHEAQQDVFHIHFHIVPRKLGDGQNVPWKKKQITHEKFEDLLKNLNQ